MTKLTRSTRTKITADWHAAFPGLGIYRPMWLLRRCGPLLSGICLQRDSSNDSYLPTAHIHCLASPFDCVAFELSQDLARPRSGSQYWISVRSHDKHFQEAIELIANQSLLPLSGPVSLEQVSAAFARYRDEFPFGRYSPNLYCDWLMTLAWAGRFEETRRLLVVAEKDIATWPPHVMLHEGGLKTWLSKMQELTSSPERIHDTVNKELAKHKAQHVPSVDVSSWLI